MKSFHRALSFVVSHMLGDDPSKAIPTWREMHNAGQLTWPEFVYLADNCACLHSQRRYSVEAVEGTEYKRLADEFDAIACRLDRDYEPAIDARWDDLHAQIEEMWSAWEVEALASAGATDLIELRKADIIVYDGLKKTGEYTLFDCVRRGSMIPAMACLADPKPATWMVCINHN
jgi:hypothetical protein